VRRASGKGASSQRVPLPRGHDRSKERPSSREPDAVTAKIPCKFRARFRSNSLLPFLPLPHRNLWQRRKHGTMRLYSPGALGALPLPPWLPSKLTSPVYAREKAGGEREARAQSISLGRLIDSRRAFTRAIPILMVWLRSLSSRPADRRPMRSRKSTSRQLSTSGGA
jgi:hypothetical protein